MGIRREQYSMAVANDLMRAYREGYAKGGLTKGIVGLSIGTVGGFALAMYLGCILAKQDQNGQN